MTFILWLMLAAVPLATLNVHPNAGEAPLVSDAEVSISPAFASGTVCLSKGFDYNGQTNEVNTECWPIGHSHRWTRDIRFAWGGDWTVAVAVRGRIGKEEVAYRTPWLRLHITDEPGA
jgi:hypothetical protein